MNMVITAGIRHAIGQPDICQFTFDTKTLAVATAAAYSAPGDDYREHEHGHRSRPTEAIHRAYAATDKDTPA